MGKSKKNRAAATNQIQLKSQTTAEAFSFGDPVPVLDRRELLDYVECVQMDRWYEPPVSFDGLARTYRAAVHHSSPIAVKRDILSSTYIPHRLLSQKILKRPTPLGLPQRQFVTFALAHQGKVFRQDRQSRPAIRSLRQQVGSSRQIALDTRPRHHLDCRHD